MALLWTMTPRLRSMTDSTMLRAVLDTNIIIAALKSKKAQSPNAELLRRWVAGEFALLYTYDLEAEYREKCEARGIDFPIRSTFFRNLYQYGERIELAPNQVQPIVLADPDDDVVLACALVGRATHLVTYDPHLLSLGSSYQGVLLLDGLHFLYAVRGDTPVS
jgi:putative PIN family toxin of toxin-antitoxin system